MNTDKQHQANIHNSKLGGVRTEEGKNISRFNALKHGVLRNSLTEYESGMYVHILEDLIDELKPSGIIESLLVERIALCYLRFYRVSKAEGEFIKEQLHPYSEKHSTDRFLGKNLLHQADKVTFAGYQAQIKTKAIQELDQTLLRYDTTVENKLYKALRELNRLQRIRRGEEVSDATILELRANGFVSRNE